jgi:hypothetical protein
MPAYISNIRGSKHPEVQDIGHLAVELPLKDFFDRVREEAGPNYRMGISRFAGDGTALVPDSQRMYLWVFDSSQSWDSEGQKIENGDVGVSNREKPLIYSGVFDCLYLDVGGDVSADPQEARFVHLRDLPNIPGGCALNDPTSQEALEAASRDPNLWRKFPLTYGLREYRSEKESEMRLVDSHDVRIGRGPEAYHNKITEIYHVREISPANGGIVQAVHIHPNNSDLDNRAYIEAMAGDLMLFPRGVVHHGCAVRRESLGTCNASEQATKLADGYKLTNVIVIPGFCVGDENILAEHS